MRDLAGDTEDVQKADLEARRRDFVLLLAATAVGASILTIFDRNRAQLEAWLIGEPALFAERVAIVFILMTVAACGPLLTINVYLLRLSQRITRDRRFPPLGMKVIRDTPILRDEAALRRARLTRTFAALVLIGAIAIAVLMAKLWMVLAQPTADVASR